MANIKLTIHKVAALKAGKRRYDVMDREPGFGVHVSTTGAKSFILYTRLPGTSHPTRLALAAVGEGTEQGLSAAREKARQWKALIKAGDDPREIEAREARAKAEARANTLAAAASDYFHHIKTREKPMRRADFVERTLRRELLEADDVQHKKLRDRPIAEIEWADLRRIVDAKKKAGKKSMARHLLALIRAFFSWVADEEVYGLKSSPCAGRRPKKVVGEANPRQRFLSDAEIRLFWRATEKLGYPFGDLFKVLLLTGQRRSEGAEIEHGEFDLIKAEWIVPADKMKKDHPHFVPLSPSVVEILRRAPKHNMGKYAFSGTAGFAPVSGFSKALRALHDEMNKILREETRDKDAEIEKFRIHDLRRTTRTNLSRYTTFEVAERIIAHNKQGNDRTYNLFEFADEKRTALGRWARHVAAVVAGGATNVVQFKNATPAGSKLYRIRVRKIAEKRRK